MSAPVSLPVFPTEILAEIVDLHAQLSGKAEDWPHKARRWLPSMLALLSTSRQFRLLAIRHIFHDVHFYCGCTDRHRSMKKLKRLIMPGAADLPLGSMAPHIKSLWIHTEVYPDDSDDDTPSDTSLDDDTSSDTHTDDYDPFHTPLLDSIRKQSPMSFLSIAAFMVNDMPCPWDAFPLGFRQTLVSFFQSPSLKTFQSSGISEIRGELFKNARIQTLSITDSVMEFGRFDDPAANKSSTQNHHIISLLIHHSDIPDSLSLPNLQHLSLVNLPHATLNAWWPIIASSWKNLVSLEISDNVAEDRDLCSYSIPKLFSIILLPKLEVFNYRHVQKPANTPLPPTVLPPITLFQVTDSGFSALKHIFISIYFETVADTKEEIISRVATDPSWDTLDRILTSVCFPSLEKVKITLQQHLIVSVHALPRRRKDLMENRDARETARETRFEVEAALRSSFSRLMKKGSVSLELESIVHPHEFF